MKPLALLFSFLLVSALPQGATAMAFQVSGQQLLMQGPVVDGDLARLKNAFAEHPGIDTVVLRNSFGGDAWTGYRVGEWLRDRGVTTVVSGWCVSACSRMFLGGVKRLFSSDFAASGTYLGFHGHYQRDRTLDRASVRSMGLKSWILRFAGPGLPEAMVDAWIDLPKNTQTVNFYPPQVADQHAASVFQCAAPQATPAACVPMQGSALSLGIVTEDRLFASFDQAQLVAAAQARAAQYPASGFAEVSDLSRLPLDAGAGVDNYKRYLLAPSPKAFVVAPSRSDWAWNAGDIQDPVAAALRRCEERAGQACVLYAVDGVVVFRP